MRTSPVSLVILAHNGVAFTRYTLGNLLQATTIPQEIFLVDNASCDGTPELFREWIPRFEQAGAHVIFWRNEENKGCSLARNEAWQQATCKYTVFLDNDAPPRSRRWLETFVEKMEADPQLAILGPKLVYPYLPHRIQCAGVWISKLARVVFSGRGEDISHFGCERDVKGLISACWMMRTNLRETIGMLDEWFHPVQYEDIDLCMRTWLAGFRVVYTPAVEMYHFEGITTASWGQEHYQVNIARNSLKFRERYHQVLVQSYDEIPPEALHWKKQEELGLTPQLDLTMI